MSTQHRGGGTPVTTTSPLPSTKTWHQPGAVDQESTVYSQWNFTQQKEYYVIYSWMEREVINYIKTHTHKTNKHTKTRHREILYCLLPNLGFDMCVCAHVHMPVCDRRIERR